MENNDMQIDQETLASILKEHHLWIESDGKSGKRADLSEKDLKNVDLMGADLRKADLRKADLLGADLRVANLRGANLRGVDLRGADLAVADLCEADLCEADLRGADLREADLCEADLCEADLRRANLHGAKLEKAYLKGANLEGANFDAQFFENYASAIEALERKSFSSDMTIWKLEDKLHQAQSETVKNDEEITKLKEQLNLEKSEKQKITQKLEELNNLLNQRELRGRIKDAQKSLSEALKNTDKQIKNNEASASCFSELGIVLFSIAIVLLIFFSMAVLFHPEYISEKKLNILFYTFPIITLMLIGTTCLRHQKNLLAEVRHFSNMKHQIELYSGLLEASQHAAVSFNNPEKANEYVQETFTQIRNRLLNSQYLPDHSSSDNQSDNDFGSEKVIDLLSKIADLSGKKPI